jgi:hypothetical protein
MRYNFAIAQAGLPVFWLLLTAVCVRRAQSPSDSQAKIQVRSILVNEPVTVRDSQDQWSTLWRLRIFEFLTMV